MPYLNWKEREIQKSMAPSSSSPSTLSLTLTPRERAEIVPFLEEIYVRGGSELRLDLPGQWILFWKSRESESRLLLAHPQKDEWVTTIALEKEHGLRIIERLRSADSASAGDAFSISELGVVGQVSNVEVILCNG
jgi:hypothetical protein